MTTIAILGLGSIGLRHAKNLMALKINVLAFDPDAERRNLAAADGIATTSDRDAALASADAVVIASPSGQHLQDLTDVAHRHLHAFVEKPLAHTDKGVEGLLRKYDDNSRIVFAGLNLRFNPAAQTARRIVSEKTLGTILWARFHLSDYLPNWRPHQNHRHGYAADPATGGVLFDVIHEFDLANFLLGPAKTVAAASRNSGTLDISSEDSADVILRHDSGVLSTLHLDYATRPRQRTTIIAGTDSSLHLDLDARSVSVINLEGVTTDVINHPGDYADDYKTEMAAFLASIAGEQSPVCDGWQALDILRQVLSARRHCSLPETKTLNT